jgi:hypothetical protein cdivTM_06942
MQNQFLKTLTRQLASWFLVVVLLQTPIMVFLNSHWPEYRWIFKAFSEIYLAVLVVLTLLVGWLTRAVWRSRLLQLGLVYGLWQVAMALLLGGNLIAVVGGLLLNLRFVALFAVFYAVGVYNRQLIQAVIKKWWWAVGAVMIFAVAQIVLLPKDFLANFGYSTETIMPYLTVDQNHALVRINSTLRGPNPLGALCVIVLAYILMKQRSRLDKADWLMIGVVGLVLIWTWSRSAWLAVVVMVVGGLILKLSVADRQKYTRIGASLLVSGGIVLMFLISQFPNSQLAHYFQQVVLHHNPQSSSVGKSNQEHSSSIQLALTQIRQRPFGSGVGSTGTPSVYNQRVNIIENYYLAMMVEVGIIGGVMFLALNVAVLRQLYCHRQQWLAGALLISGVGLVVINLVLPMWADDAVSYSWWGLAGLCLALINQTTRSKYENY